MSEDNRRQGRSWRNPTTIINGTAAVLVAAGALYAALAAMPAGYKWIDQAKRVICFDKNKCGADPGEPARPPPASSTPPASSSPTTLGVQTRLDNVAGACGGDPKVFTLNVDHFTTLTDEDKSTLNETISFIRGRNACRGKNLELQLDCTVETSVEQCTYLQRRVIQYMIDRDITENKISYAKTNYDGVGDGSPQRLGDYIRIKIYTIRGYRNPTDTTPGNLDELLGRLDKGR